MEFKAVHLNSFSSTANNESRVSRPNVFELLIQAFKIWRLYPSSYTGFVLYLIARSIEIDGDEIIDDENCIRYSFSNKKAKEIVTIAIVIETYVELRSSIEVEVVVKKLHLYQQYSSFSLYHHISYLYSNTHRHTLLHPQQQNLLVSITNQPYPLVLGLILQLKLNALNNCYLLLLLLSSTIEQCFGLIDWWYSNCYANCTLVIMATNDGFNDVPALKLVLMLKATRFVTDNDVTSSGLLVITDAIITSPMIFQCAKHYVNLNWTIFYLMILSQVFVPISNVEKASSTCIKIHQCGHV
ncbi:hypothetical protein ACTFIU_002437 [Dictyostelium citrinum]